MSPVDGSKKLAAVVKKLRSRFAGAVAATPPTDDSSDRDITVDTLVYSLLLWETTNTNATAGWKKLHETFIDYNDLRAALPEEIASALGDKYPRCEERALRIRAVLHDLYGRFHAVSGAGFASLGKRELRALFESIEGLCDFAANRTLALCFDVHAVPVDERLKELLVSEAGVSSDAEPRAIAHMLERITESERAKELCAVLESWSDSEGVAARKEKRTVAKPAKTGSRSSAKKSGSAAGKRKPGKGTAGG